MTKAATSSPLTAEDLKRLRKFRIEDSVLEQAQLRRYTDQQARAAGFRCDGAKDLSGIVFPNLDVESNFVNARMRRDNAEINEKGEEENKYITLPKSVAPRRSMYILRQDRKRLIENPKVSVVVVEGEKSVLAIASYARRKGDNLVPVAIGGCDGWRGLEDLKILQGHNVAILLDANVASSERVQNAELEFATHLTGLGCPPSIFRLPMGPWNGPDDFLASRKDVDFNRVLTAPPVEPWLDLVGVDYDTYLRAQPPNWVIKDFLMEQGVTLISGLAGQGKSWMLLSMAHCLLAGKQLFGHFPVLAPAKRVIYLTPEIGLGSFKLRAEKFGLGDYIKNRKLLVRTLSQDYMELTDPALLLAAKDADIFLDTIVRFQEGDENAASDNRKLADALFGLLSAGARTIVGAHHSPKALEGMKYLSLENAVRGSGDIGAMAVGAWGIRAIEPHNETRIYVVNIKARDFEPVPPFILKGRPHIDAGLGLQVEHPPGECEPLEKYLENGRKTGRKPSDEKQERMKLIDDWVDQGKSNEEISALVKKLTGNSIADTTITKEISEARSRRKYRRKTALKQP